MLPTSQDEPALQVAFVQALVKLIVGMPVAGGFILGHNLSAALAVFVAAFVASGWSVVQGWVTRSKVFAPANVPASPAPEVQQGESLRDPSINR